MDAYKFDVKYFSIEEAFTDPQASQAETEQVYVQFEANFSREQFDGLSGGACKQRKSNKGKVLMIFNDKSGSMSGSPFTALTEGCLDLAPSLFPNLADRSQNPFEKVHVCYYSFNLERKAFVSKDSYTECIRQARVDEGTNFIDCLGHIHGVINKAEPESEFFILFLTDGKETCYLKNDVKTFIQKTQAFLKEKAETKFIQSTIYTLSLSRHHDATLLNEMAQMGSQMGNFIFIDTQQPGYQEKIAESLQESLSLPLSSRSKKKVQLHDTNLGINICKTYEVTFDFDVKKEAEIDPQDGGQPVGEKAMESDDWTNLKFFFKAVMPANQILSQSLVATISIKKGIEVQGALQCMEVMDVPVDLRMQAELQMINEITFKLIQQLQAPSLSHEQKQQSLETIRAIDQNLDMKRMAAMLIKKRAMKKDILAQLQESKQRTSNVIARLRNIQNLSNLPNDLIAKLNDMAFKAIKRTSLNKKLDKRALKNETLYQKLEAELDDIVRNLDMDKISRANSEVINDIGKCPLSVMSTVDAIESGDCMCLSLSIGRPEAAIADPGRLIIKDVFPTYFSADNFLESAKYQLQNQGGVVKKAVKIHRGFHPKAKGRIALGLAREDVTGVMPLYLFKEHWMIAKRKVQPLFGFMCTLDIMGYSFGQYQVVPFLVLAKLMEKVDKDPKEVNKRMLAYVEETCIQIIKESREKLLIMIYRFISQPEGKSTRTKDAVKSVKVMAGWLYCILKLDVTTLTTNAQLIALFDSKEAIKKTRMQFARVAFEEILRRKMNLGDLLTDPAKLLPILYEDHLAFHERVFGARQKEIEDLHNVKPDEQANSFKKDDKEVEDLKERLGYGQEYQDMKKKKKETKETAEQTKARKICFEKEIKALPSQTWAKASPALSLMKTANKVFKKHFNIVGTVIKNILEEKSQRTLSSFPGMDYLRRVPKFHMVLAILIKNAYHKKNSKRTKAVEKKTYKEFETPEQAVKYLTDLRNDMLMVDLRNAERELIKKYQDSSSDELAEKVLLAPDQFYAALMMKNENLFFGRGDFQKILGLLQARKSPDFKDIANKLVLVKRGYLAKKKFSQDLNAEEEKVETVEYAVPETAKFVVYNDKNRIFTDFAIKSKHVFRIWARQVYENPNGKSCLTQTQLENVFPEFKAKLQMYKNCCDETGRIVKGHDYYKEYKSTPHRSSRRGGASAQSLKKQAKKQKAKHKLL